MTALLEHPGDAAHTSARCLRYCNRLDPWLESLPSNGARIAFLTRELDKWTRLYDDFKNLVDKGLAPEDDGPDVYDYMETICAISVRKERLNAKE